MKKLLSILLVLAMIASLFANVGVVFAVDGYEASIGSENYETLEAAVKAVQDGETIKLLSDVKLSAGLTVNKSFGFTLDGDGFSIAPANSEVNLGYQAVYFYGGATYTIKDVTFKDFVQTNVTGPVLRLESAEKFNLINVTFDNCDVAKGTGTEYSVMRIYNTDFEADGLTITNCKAGMLMDIGPSSDYFVGKIEIKNSKFENNTVLGTALIYTNLESEENSYLSVSNTEFVGNVIGDAGNAAPQGRGVIHLGSDAYVDGCTFDGNAVYGSHANNVCYGINEYSGYTMKYTNNVVRNSVAYQTNEKIGPVSGLAFMAVGELVLEDNVVEANNQFFNRASADAEYTELPARSVGSYSASYGTTTIISGTYNGELVTYSGTDSLKVSGGTFTTDVSDYCVDGFTCEANGDGTFGIVAETPAVATVNGTPYETLKEAIAALTDGDTLVIADNVTLSEGSIKLPAALKNVTIKGGANSVLKDMVLMSADGNSLCYEGLTFDGIIFDNSYIVITGWRNNGVSFKDITVTNCTFKNIYNDANTAAVHINVDASEAVNGFTFTNNVIDGALGGSKSGLYLQATGEVKVENNVINNVAFRPYVIQLTSDDGVSDNFVVTGNTFSGSAAGRAQGLSNNAEGTDSVNIVVSNNIFKDITNAQQICYWNFNAEKTSATLSNNYYDIDINENPQKIYFNSPAESEDDLYEMGVYPFYTELNEDGTINTESACNYVPAPPVATVDGVGFADLQAAVDAADSKTVVLVSDVVLENSLTIAKDTTVTIDLAGYKISGVDTTEKNFGLINNNGTLTVNDTKGTGKITLSATINSGWNRYSAVISNNPGGTLTVNGGALEHLGGTDMAYGIDSLTNGGIGDVKVTINGGSVTSTYRAIRQFLNSDSKQNELVINGGTITGAKQAIFFHDPSAKANNGKLTITENAAINGGVYLFVTEGSTEWPVEVSIAAAAIKTGEVTSKNVPEGYEVKNENGVYGVGEVTCVATVDDVEYADLQAAFNAADGKTVVLMDNITTNGTITIPADVVVTLDMNGKTITANDDRVTGNYELFYNYGSLTVIGNGTINLTATTDRDWNASSSIFHNRGGVLVIENGTFVHNGGTDMAYVIDNSGNSYGDATTTVKDGTLSTTYIAIRNRMDTYGANGGGNGVATVNIEGGNLSGKYAIWGQVSSAGVKGAINITGGTFTAAEGRAAVLVDEDATSDINTAISGGTFSSDVSDYCVDGFTCEQNADGTYGVVEVEYDTWDTKGGFIKGLPDEQNSITMLLVVGIQGRSYAEAGFEVTVGDTVVPMPTNVVYTKINIKDAEGKLIDSLVGSTFGDNTDYILCAKVLLPTDFDGADISFRAYLVDYEGNKMYAKNTNGSLDYVGTIGRVVNN